MHFFDRVICFENGFVGAILFSTWICTVCQEDDFGNLSDDVIKDMMDMQRKEQAKNRQKNDCNVTKIEKRKSDIVKGRGELTGDLLRHELIADFIYDCPFIVCTVEWVEGNFADLGNLIPLDVVNHPPYWLDWKGNKTEYYTFIMSGLDEPSRKNPSLREFQHWVIVNIPGNKLNEGETLVSYVGPNPAEDTGLHRHGIVVYKQPHKIEFNEKPIKSRNEDYRRGNFSNIDFANKYEMGEPVAINFFQTERTTQPASKRPSTDTSRKEPFTTPTHSIYNN